ncbi:BglG family transcription antiterminator [Halanaerocella petrolearia]
MNLNRLSSRQKEIIVNLIKSSNFVTLKQLAEQLEVSKKTVHREISKLKVVLKDTNLNLKTKPGVGVSIEGNKELIENIKLKLQSSLSDQRILTPQERENYIIQEFLLSDCFNKLTALAHKLSVTEATISYDLNRVSNWFKKRGLSLERRQGVGVELKGSETAFRRAILDFLYQNLGEKEVLNLIQNDLNKVRNSQTKSKILNFINLESFSDLQRVVNKTLRETNSEMINSSYIGLMIHLSLAIKRLKMGERIYIDEDKLYELKPTEEYQVAEKIASKLEKIFNLSIPSEEIGYITMHLKGAKLKKNLEIKEAPLDTEELEIIKLARILVKEVEKELKTTLSNDFNLISGLVTHLAPAISRLKLGMDIRNPIVDKLKDEYNEIFIATKKAANKIAQIVDRDIPDAEIGFLTMHIAAAIENDNNLERKPRVLVVCSSGVGSSKILATRLRKTIEDIEIVDQASSFSVNQETVNNKGIDLVISTHPLDNYEGDSVVVSPILLPDEVEKIKGKLGQVEIDSLENEKEEENKEFELEDKLETINTISNDMMAIIDNFKITKIQDIKDYNQIIERASEEEFLSSGAESELVYKALKAREEKGATIIPEINLSLLHARTEGVEKPFIGLIILDEPIFLADSNKVKKEVDRIVVLLAPKDPLPEEIKLLSSFSSSIVENKKFYKIVRKGKKEDFLIYLRNVLEDYYKTLVDKGG